MDKLRVGIAGATGGMGRPRLEAFHANPRSVVTALSSRSPEKLDEAAQATGARVFVDELEMAASDAVDAVCISTPNTLHARAVTAALQAGKHVCVEYPLVQTLEEATALGATARKKGLVLNHAMTVRLESRHLALRSALPRIGRPISAHIRYFGGGGWYLDGALRGDRWLAFEVHFLDQYEDLLGETQWLAASCVDGPERSCGAVLAGYPEGATLAMEFGMGFAYKPGYAATIVGERGYLWFERGEVGGEDASGTFEVPGPVSDTIARDSDSFVEQVLDGAPAVCPWPQGLRAMQLALLAGRAAREGARLAVPPLPTA